MQLLRFKTLRAKLTVQYTGIFVAGMLLLSGLLYWATDRIAAAEVERQLYVSGEIYDRLWMQRSQHLQEAAGLMARDFGFREALSTGDDATASSALANLRGRLGIESAFFLTIDGEAKVGNGLPSPEQTKAMWETFDEGQLVGVAMIDGVPRQMIAAPVTAPQLLGWIVFAPRIDKQQMVGLQKLAHMPLQASLIVKDADGRWIEAPGHNAFGISSASGHSTADLTPLNNGSHEISANGETSFLAIKAMATTRGERQAALLLLYPKSKALAAFRPIQWSIALMTLIGIPFVLYGSWRTAARLVAPVLQLDRAAERLARGEREEVVIPGEDEIARLAQRFNAMAGEIEEREKRISQLAYYDSLTGLPNRVKFQEVAARRIEALRGDGRELALLCLDLDDFKGVNDTLGHGAGDVLLRTVALRLSQFAKGEFVSRLGGDEFVVMLENGGSRTAIEQFAEELVAMMRLPLEIDSHQIVPSVSIGIALAGPDGEDAESLLRHADLALYRAKASGRGSCCFFEESFNERAQHRRQIEADLRRALSEGELEVYYQPLFDLKANTIGAFEALLRWNHPERGIVGPVEFIPIAEDTGLIGPIGDWVLREACREACNWPEHVRVAVNVSSVQFRQKGLNKIVVQALAASGLDPHRLEIEITESIFLESSEETLGVLHGLKQLGVRIALDDFGTGYSSLSYLQSFPFDKIKIDRSFIQDLLVRKGATAVVRAIVDLATALGMETTAEGVEETDQLEHLRMQGCTSVQGFLFSKPVRSGQIASMFGDDSVGRKVA